MKRTELARQVIAEKAARAESVMMAAAPFGGAFSPWSWQVHDGEKFDGGLGPVRVPWTDYWALRARSAAFFKTNQYGRGIIRRLVTNFINTGLALEADPLELLLPQLDEESAEEWAIDVETKFEAWAGSPDVCDWSKSLTFGQMQQVAEQEALISGDVLVIEHHNKATGLPCYEMIDGSLIDTPIGGFESENPVMLGVELDKQTREHVAYFVRQGNGESRRIPARGRNGRRLAWLVYATDKRHCDVRGEPLLSLVMQGVSEVDRYRDTVQRKASVGALFSVFFATSADAKGISTKPISAGAQRRVAGSTSLSDGTDYKFDIASTNPGVVYEHLPPGVEPKGFKSDATDEKFGEFEAAMLDGISWALEIPPSVLRMTFGQSYSASRGEVKEFNLVMRRHRENFAAQFCKPVYQSWLVAKALMRQISAPGLLDAWRDPTRYEELAAWTASNWWGVVKEAVDLPKEVNGQKGLVDNGWSTNAAVSRQMTGTRFGTNVLKLARENRKLAETLRPELELRREFGDQAVDQAMAMTGLKLVAGSDIDGTD